MNKFVLFSFADFSVIGRIMYWPGPVRAGYNDPVPYIAQI